MSIEVTIYPSDLFRLTDCPRRAAALLTGGLPRSLLHHIDANAIMSALSHWYLQQHYERGGRFPSPKEGQKKWHALLQKKSVAWTPRLTSEKIAIDTAFRMARRAADHMKEELVFQSSEYKVHCQRIYEKKDGEMITYFLKGRVDLVMRHLETGVRYLVEYKATTATLSAQLLMSGLYQLMCYALAITHDESLAPPQLSTIGGDDQCLLIVVPTSHHAILQELTLPQAAKRGEEVITRLLEQSCTDYRQVAENHRTTLCKRCPVSDDCQTRQIQAVVSNFKKLTSRRPLV